MHATFGRLMSNRLRVWCAVWAALLGGCGGTGSELPNDASKTRVVIGTGRSKYEPLIDEATVPLISGIQGGFHVEITFIAYGFDVDVLRMELRTSSNGDPATFVEMAGNVAVRPALDPDGVSVLTSLGWFASIFDAKCAQDRRLRLDLTVRDQQGHAASDTKYCIVEVAEEDRATNCGD